MSLGAVYYALCIHVSNDDLGQQDNIVTSI